MFTVPADLGSVPEFKKLLSVHRTDSLIVSTL